MAKVQPVTTWPTDECTITSDYESLVGDLFETAYETAKQRLTDEGQHAAYEETLAAQSLISQTDGLTHLGTGAGRIALTGDCLTSDDYVLKIATYSPTTINGASADGLTQNEQEATTWNELPARLRPWFTPIEASDDDYRWVIQPRVDTTTPLPLGDQTTDVIRTAIHAAGWHTVELNATNLGLRDGGVTIYDYGLPIRPQTEC